MKGRGVQQSGSIHNGSPLLQFCATGSLLKTWCGPPSLADGDLKWNNQFTGTVGDYTFLNSIEVLEELCSPYVKKRKTFIHPGEVNRIRELSRNSNIVAAHCDSPDIWRMIDLIYRPGQEVIAELDKFKFHRLTCSTSSSS